MPPGQLVSHQRGGSAAPLCHTRLLSRNCRRHRTAAPRPLPQPGPPSPAGHTGFDSASTQPAPHARSTASAPRPIASLIVSFIGHAAIVADMDISVGRQSHWPISRIPITFREEYSKLLCSLSPNRRFAVRSACMACPSADDLVLYVEADGCRRPYGSMKVNLGGVHGIRTYR